MTTHIWCINRYQVVVGEFISCFARSWKHGQCVKRIVCTSNYIIAQNIKTSSSVALTVCTGECNQAKVDSAPSITVIMAWYSILRFLFIRFLFYLLTNIPFRIRKKGSKNLFSRFLYTVGYLLSRFEWFVLNFLMLGGRDVCFPQI